jgi:hypothetical protein
LTLLPGRSAVIQAAGQILLAMSLPKCEWGGPVTAKTIHLANSSTKAPAHTAMRAADALYFVSVCPTCKDARFQQGYDFRTVVRFLVESQPIEAHCAVCNEFWPITANERAELAWLLLTD